MSTELDKARARLAAASPYPWRGDRVDGTVKYDVLDANGGVVVHGCNGNEDPCYGIRSEEDEAFILHAASDLAAALAEVDRLTAALAEAEAIPLRMIRAAKGGASDYLGGYHDDRLEVFRHGMGTIVTVIEAAAKMDPTDYQTRVNVAMGAALDAAKEKV